MCPFYIPVQNSSRPNRHNASAVMTTIQILVAIMGTGQTDGKFVPSVRPPAMSASGQGVTIKTWIGMKLSSIKPVIIKAIPIPATGPRLLKNVPNIKVNAR